MIPAKIKIKNRELPDRPGVYFYFDRAGDLLYIGKATSLKKRVGSYFARAHLSTLLRAGDDRIGEMVSRIARVDYLKTPTVIEALVLEANQIKVKQPPYNILERDDKSFLYLVITSEDYPRPLLMRGQELERLGIDPFRAKLTDKTKKKFLAVFGPYTSGHSLKKALDLIRKIIPWSDCQPPEATGRRRACFNVHLKKCPGVCTGAIGKKDYRRIIKHLILFFEGKKPQLIKQMEKEMRQASKIQEYEKAADLRNKIGALKHIRDVALISKEDFELPVTRAKEEIIDLDGRIEAYDISNISGTSAVGSMVVFENGQPAKDKYRKFKIKTVQGANDVAMLEEVMRRRLNRAKTYKNAWPLPEIMVIDGGAGQVNRIQTVLNELKVKVPIVGLAKGFDRKQDRLVFDRDNLELARVANRGKEIFQKARDEAHRFAIKYHRQVRGKKSLGR